MHRGKIRKMFPGSNSAYGFYSFYDQIIEDSATRIFVIKEAREWASPPSCKILPGN